MTYRTLRLSLTLGVLALGLTGFGANARAQSISVPTSGVNGQALGGMNYVSFDLTNLTPVNSTGSTTATYTGAGSGSIGVDYVNDGGVVNGPLSPNGLYAAPVLSTAVNQNLNFGAPASGVDQSNYITAGGLPESTITLNFGGSGYNYLGLLWGSVDTYNTLTFYSSKQTTALGFVTGQDVLTALSGITEQSQGPGGTAYVNILTSFAFDKVVLTSNPHAFEVDNVAFGKIGDVPPLAGTVPEPASLVMFGTAFLVVSGVTWKRNRKAKAGSQS